MLVLWSQGSSSKGSGGESLIKDAHLAIPVEGGQAKHPRHGGCWETVQVNHPMHACFFPLPFPGLLSCFVLRARSVVGARPLSLSPSQLTLSLRILRTPLSSKNSGFICLRSDFGRMTCLYSHLSSE